MIHYDPEKLSVLLYLDDYAMNEMESFSQIIVHLSEVLIAKNIPHQLLLQFDFDFHSYPDKFKQIPKIEQLHLIDSERSSHLDEIVRGEFVVSYPLTGTILPHSLVKLYQSALLAKQQYFANSTGETTSKVISVFQGVYSFDESRIVNYPRWKFFLKHYLSYLGIGNRAVAIDLYRCELWETYYNIKSDEIDSTDSNGHGGCCGKNANTAKKTCSSCSPSPYPVGIQSKKIAIDWVFSWIYQRQLQPDVPQKHCVVE
ncbi:MAG: hypothetical protein HQK53_09110 [Oligoflexia bacterium]|nr:hypothetical protein [Oligoflexia bacterium]